MRRRVPLLLAVVALLAACARGDAAAEGTGGAAVPAPGAIAPGEPGSPLTAADLDAYERGLAAETAGFPAAAARLRAARSLADSNAARGAVIDSAAAAAGVARGRYQELEYLLGSAVSRSVLNPALARTAAAGIDTAQLALFPPETQAQLRERLARAAMMASDEVVYQGIPPELQPELKRRVAGPMGALWRRRLALQGQADAGR